MANSSSLSGQRLGVYEVGPRLGVGGMGEVYRARDSKLNREVAIKVLLSAVAGDPERLARFAREAQVLAALNHPGIAHIHGLEKDRRARLADASVARFLLSERIEPANPIAPAAIATARASRGRVAAATFAGLAIGAALAAAAVWAVSPRPAPAAPVRFKILPPAEMALWMQGTDNDITIAPDGSFVVYRTGDARSLAQLAVRSMNELDGRILSGTTGARNPFVSPDGRWIGFGAQGELRKVAITGGPPTILCKIDSALRGASWGDDDAIVFSTVASGALHRVPARGGQPEVLTTPDRGKTESHSNPFVLPGARALLFTSSFGTFESAAIHALDLETRQLKTVLSGGADARVQGGVMLYATARRVGSEARMEGTLRATRFDARRLDASSESVSVIEQINVLPTIIASYAISRHGDIVYLPGGAGTGQAARRTMVWVDRKGQEQAIPSPVRAYAIARISPDQSRVVVDVRDQTNDIWIWDLRRQTLTPLNRDGGQDMSPLWMPDGSRIVWTSTRGGGNPNLYWQTADGTGTAERLMNQPTNQFPTSITPDGSQVVWFGAVGSNHTDLFRTRLTDSDRKAEALIGTPSMEFGGEISPDGRWLAYHSNESGEYQVYVRPFPSVQEGRFHVSTAGGTRPAWARTGRELFYLDAEGLLTSVMVRAEAKTFFAKRPVKVLSTPYYPGRSALGLDLRGYDISGDGQRFLMIKEVAGAQQGVDLTTSLTVVLNWLEEVKARLPAQ